MISSITRCIVIIVLVLFSIPHFTLAQFQTKNINYTVQNTIRTTDTSSSNYILHCTIGDTLTNFQYYTRVVGGSRPFAMLIDNVQVGATTTLTTTPAWAVFSPLNIPCLDGRWDIKFNLLGSTYYSYENQLIGSPSATSSPYSLLQDLGGGSLYYSTHRATYVLPITIATSTTMSTTTIGISPFTDSLLFLLGIIASALIFLLLVKIIWKP